MAKPDKTKTVLRRKYSKGCAILSDACMRTSRQRMSVQEVVKLMAKYTTA
jgi:hypothetical protein